MKTCRFVWVRSDIIFKVWSSLYYFYNLNFSEISPWSVFALAFIPASFVVFLIEEKASGSKHLQFLAGLNPMIYWTANYLWDIFIFIFPTILSLIIFACFSATAFIGPNNIGCLVLLFILFGLSVTPLMYMAVYIFNKPATAYVALTGRVFIMHWVFDYKFEEILESRKF